jgi:predicted phosphoadenosine phosphosulfate sulfurtransferase
MARLNVGAKGITGTNTIYPIYDWKTRDVWLYLKDNSVRTPEIYQHMWQAGIGKNQLRVSQFFSSDTASSLVRMNEYYPDLMDRVIRREPNAYLASLYWDSEMFGRKTSRRKKLEGETGKDYKALVKDMLFTRPEHYFTTPHKLTVARQYRKMLIKLDNHARPTDYRKIHEALTAGDPKMRTLRAIYQDISTAYAAYAKGFRYKKT